MTKNAKPEYREACFGCNDWSIMGGCGLKKCKHEKKRRQP